MEINIMNMDKYEQKFTEKYNRKIDSFSWVFILVSCIGVMSYSIWDWIAIPDLWTILFIMRLSSVIVGIIVIILQKRKIISGYMANICFLLAVYLVFSYGASLITDTNALLVWNLSASIAGFIWVVAVVTFPFKTAIYLSGYYFVLTVIFLLINSASMMVDYLLNGGIFVICFIVMVPFIHFKRYKDYKHIYFLEIELQEKREELEKQANYDALTNAFSRRKGFEQLEERMALSKREKVLLTLCYIDVDNLKETNDSLGHTTGDQLLQNISASIIKCIRSTDIFCRLGGDEFFIAFYNSNLKQSHETMKRIEIDLAKMAKDEKHPSEISYGIVAIDYGKVDSVDTFIDQADKAMYKMKKNKRKVSTSKEEETSVSIR